MPRLTKEQDIARVKDMFTFDSEFLQTSKNPNGVILGIDEVGRGPVAGPVCAGGVVFARDAFVKGLNDSKKLSPKKRESVAQNICEVALFHTVKYCSSEIIDEIGIAEALRSVFRAVIDECEHMGFDISMVLLDGNATNIDPREVNVIKGDAKSAAIAAASVVAKVERDAYMDKLSSRYPIYHFEKNKGYGTKEHLQAITTSGICLEHRITFLTKYIV